MKSAKDCIRGAAKARIKLEVLSATVALELGLSVETVQARLRKRIDEGVLRLHCGRVSLI